MTTTTLAAPNWPHCGRDADSDHPHGCRGRRVEPYGQCLAHLDDADRSAYLASLEPGAHIDHRGTRISQELSRELIAALNDPETGWPSLGAAFFSYAEFEGTAEFTGAIFKYRAEFFGTHFDVGWFSGAEFHGDAMFGGAVFDGDAGFLEAEFKGRAWFHGAKFGVDEGETFFDGAKLRGPSNFEEAEFGGTGVSFYRAVLEQTTKFGPLVCEGPLVFKDAVFGAAVTIEAATPLLLCNRTRWASTAALRLRYAEVFLDDAIMEYPVSISPLSRPISLGPDQSEPDMGDTRVKIESLSGVDAAHLFLNNVDLTDCRFVGTIHLDQLRMEGRCVLPEVPSRRRRHHRRQWQVHWTPRRTVAEEQHWRAARRSRVDGWVSAPRGVEIWEPASVAPVYRQLRKSFEDSKNEPDAADFYYGEMEMRRHDTTRSTGERVLLAVYWAISGYGLRASRALGWLLVAMITTVIATVLWGVPKDDPKSESTGIIDGRKITMTTDTPDPVNPDGSLTKRMTAKRFEKSLRIVINSVVFRSSGQDLTTRGTYIEMMSRITEPVLLGFAVLAIRNRVKR
ncbi:pentapeptide repeat-containing protein [Stenotrophomonas sp. NPDC087984]